MSSGQLEGASIVGAEILARQERVTRAGTRPGMTVASTSGLRPDALRVSLHERPIGDDAFLEAMERAVVLWIGEPKEGREEGLPSTLPPTGRVITLDARRARRLIRRHGNADWSGRRRALRGKCQPVATPLTRSGPAPPWRRSALRGNEVALERLQLPGCQWPFPATPAAAPTPLGDAAHDGHFNRHRSQGVAELAPIGESEGETWGHGGLCSSLFLARPLLARLVSHTDSALSLGKGSSGSRGFH